MQDKEMERLMKTIDAETAPPDGLKEKLLAGILGSAAAEPCLTPFERFVFEKPLRAALAVALAVSGSLWAAMGKGFADFFSSIIG